MKQISDPSGAMSSAADANAVTQLIDFAHWCTMWARANIYTTRVVSNAKEVSAMAAKKKAAKKPAAKKKTAKKKK